MTTNSYRKESVQVSSNLRIAKVSNMFEKEEESKVVIPSINHVFCIDISGSMYGSLSKMRTQLKSKLVEIVSENDTVSLIWFDQNCGFISELVHINSANDVREMNKKIDEYLKPGGWTNFYDPIVLTNKLIDRVESTEGLWNFIFLSDGGHNASFTWDQIISELSKLQSKVSSATIIEYGYYADSARLSNMAEVLGGSKIFSEQFEDYEVDIQNILQSKISTTRVEFNIDDFKANMRIQLMFAIDEGTKSIKVYSTDRKHSILIPEGTTELYYVEDLKGDKIQDIVGQDWLREPLYAAIYVFADRMKYDIAEELLYSSRDMELIDMYCNSFGKQKLAAFNECVLGRIFDDMTTITLSDVDYKPNPKAYCLLDLLEDLMESDENKIHINHSGFNYQRTGAKSVVKRVLTEDEKKKLIEADTKLKTSKVLDEVEANSVKMRIEDPSKGYSINNLVWNSERSNISFQVTMDVILELPKGNPAGIEEYKTFIIRNYTLVKDGILNVTELPVALCEKTSKKLGRKGLLSEVGTDGVTILSFGNLPIINKKRTESVFMYQIAKSEVELLEKKTYRKYLSWLKNSIPSSISGNLTKQLSVEASSYLSGIGVTPMGYSPKTELDKSGDFYMANSLVSKIEKYSSIPSVDKVLKKIEDGKSLTSSESLLSTCINNINASIDIKDRGEIDELYEKYNSEVKDLIKEISQSKFSLIMSRKWFKDKTGFDDNSMIVTINGEDLTIKFEFVDQKVDL